MATVGQTTTFLLTKETKMLKVLQSEGVFKLECHPRAVGSACNGCGVDFDIADAVEVVLDRVGHRCYLIHLTCWYVLVEKLERGA